MVRKLENNVGNNYKSTIMENSFGLYYFSITMLVPCEVMLMNFLSEIIIAN